MMNHSDPTGNGAQRPIERVSAGQRPADARLRELAALISSSPHNLVAAGERDAVFERHVLECDALAAVLAPEGRWMDLGTGGGLPGLVLAIRHPATRWVLVDATAKKVEAVRAFAEVLGLTNVVTVQARAEGLAHAPDHRGVYDGVVTRALAPLPTLVELGCGFLRAGGTLVAVKGPRWEQEVSAAQGALRRLGLRVVHTEQLPNAARPSWVVTMRADGRPPAGFPRRDGIPKQDPLS